MNQHRRPIIDSSLLNVDPIERADTIPSSWYVDTQFYDVDRETLFLPSWQFVCHDSQLPNRGDFVADIVAGEPVILVRADDGRVKAFYNVCRHRGGPLTMDGCGNAMMLQCKYHGWTYRLDGTLRGVPRFDRSELFDKQAYGLTPIDVQEWDGLHFVCLSGKGPPLSSIVDGISERIAPMRLRGKSHVRRMTYDMTCNWKVYIDNYLEGYHLPLVHPELCDVLDYRAYATETSQYYSLQFSPLRDAAKQYGVAAGEAFYYYIFPNLTLNILPGRLQTNVIIPLAHDRTRVVFDFYYDNNDSDEALATIEADIEFSDRVQKEDIEICEFVQRGLASTAYDTGRFSPDAEQGVYHFHTLLKQAYGRWLFDSGDGADD